MARSYMLNLRDETETGYGYLKAPMRYCISDKPAAKLATKDAWETVSSAQFVRSLLDETAAFPMLDEADNEEQRHLSLFVHGYNNTWEDSAKRYASIQSNLYNGKKGLGVLVLYAWPSDGNVAGYLPDREDARDCAPDLADVLVMLSNEIQKVQRALAMASTPADKRYCRAKVSVIAHSMGAFVMQKALAIASRKLNNPQLITLIHQLALVAADVDNDLFQQSQAPTSDGILMTNLCYRIGALYSGLDQVLGASAGLKHFGTRRLGRSGLADRNTVIDNVFDLDVTALIETTPGSTHSAVFNSPDAMALLRRILVGEDRHRLS